jgi:hypothetical protein
LEDFKDVDPTVEKQHFIEDQSSKMKVVDMDDKHAEQQKRKLAKLERKLKAKRLKMNDKESADDDDFNEETFEANEANNARYDNLSEVHEMEQQSEVHEMEDQSLNVAQMEDLALRLLDFE